MARSSYIYIVRTLDGELVIAFTVRHELVTWLERDDNKADLPRLRIDRVRDGREGKTWLGVADGFLKELHG